MVCNSLNTLSLSVLTAYDNSKTKGQGFVDASSSYKIEVPYGDYYIVFKSKNRSRPLVPEFLNRYEIHKVTLKEPQYILSVDFEL